MPVPLAKHFLARDFLVQVAQVTNERMALTLVFDTIDDALLAGDFELCDEALRLVNPNDLTLTVAIGFACITLAAKEILIERADYMRRLRQRILTTDPDRVERLLQGLE